MSVFLRMFKHLLPSGRAWRITTDKPLRRLFLGISGTGADVRAFADKAWLDIRPQDTREISEWEAQHALYGTPGTDAARRSRLAAAWQAVGGQDPRYIQDTLQAAGFDVYVHEWWEPGSAPPVGVAGKATARNPLLVLRAGTALMVEAGEIEAQAGEEWAQAGNRRGAAGYPLVNSGDNYPVPTDPNQWPHFLYIGGADFGTIARVPTGRRDELEALLLKIRPLNLWIGLIVEYY